MMFVPLLNTKLNFPLFCTNIVSRPRLVERLHAGLRGPLTLVSAPAGYGKTTLLCEWRISHYGRSLPLAWLSLDGDDNDPTRFLAYFISAIRILKPGFGEIAFLSLQAPQPPSSQVILANLVNELSEIDKPFVFVLDDYHVITTQLIHDAMAFLLDHLPSQMHLVILSRADPPLPLARLRSRAQLTEIRISDLRFISSEVRAFYEQVMGLTLSTDDISALEHRTEGWAAGLQLAGLSMQGRNDISQFISTFTGGHHYIVDYLVDEVLNRQSEYIKEFLFKTSPLDRLCGNLCDAVIGRQDGQETLECLDQNNLFLIPLDNERRWYRYHHLFVEVLRSRQKQVPRDEIKNIHRRAAEWFENNGWIDEAVNHALAGGDEERAGRLIEQNNRQLLAHGELVAVLGGLNKVSELVPRRPGLCIDKAWALMLTGHSEGVEDLLQHAEELISKSVPDPATQHLRGNIAAIRCYIASRSGDAQLGLQLGLQALDSVPEDNPGVRGVVHMAVGGAYLLQGNTPGAIQAMREASRLGLLAGNVHVAVTAIAAVANLLAAQGQLRQAEHVLRDALRLAVSSDGRALPIAARISSGLSRLSYEWNDLDAALEFTQQTLEFGQKWGNADSLATAHVMRARIMQAFGDFHDAEEAINSAENIVRTHVLTPTSAEWVELTRIWLWLVNGNFAACERWVQENNPSLGVHKPGDQGKRFITARILLAEQDHARALELLRPFLNDCEASGHWGSVIEILTCQALAFQQAGDNSTALKILERAFSLAENEGYVRTFLDEGAPMLKLLRLAGSKGIRPRYVSSLLAEVDRFPGTAPAFRQPLIEPLSNRELEVLGLISAGKSNQEIAAELVLSLGTVKSHLNHIFNKLNVVSRTQCIARARELKLLS